MKLKMTLLLLFLAASLKVFSFEVEAVSSDLGTVLIITDLGPAYPPVLFALDRETFAETTAQLEENVMLQDDYDKLRKASEQIRDANSLLYQDNVSLREQNRALRQTLLFGSIGITAVVLGAIVIGIVLK